MPDGLADEDAARLISFLYRQRRPQLGYSDCAAVERIVRLRECHGSGEGNQGKTRAGHFLTGTSWAHFLIELFQKSVELGLPRQDVGA